MGGEFDVMIDVVDMKTVRGGILCWVVKLLQQQHTWRATRRKADNVT